MRIATGTKEADIIEAGVRVFGDCGFHNAKMAKIAEEAGVSAGTLYNYFSDKAHILNRIFEDLWISISAKINRVVGRDDIQSVEKIEGVIDIIFETFTENRLLAMVFINEFSALMNNPDVEFVRLYGEFVALCVAIIEEGQAKKVFNPNISAMVQNAFIIGGVRRVIHNMALSSNTYDQNDIRRDVKQMVKRGIVIQ